MTREELLKKITPGVHPEGAPFEELRPCGNCDGVLYLGGGFTHTEEPDGTITKTAISGLECQKQALSYLKPMPKLWQVRHGKKGISHPLSDGAVFVPREMWELQAETGRSIEWYFTCEPHGLCPAAEKYRQYFHVVKVQPTLWALVFDGPKDAQPEPAAIMSPEDAMKGYAAQGWTPIKPPSRNPQPPEAKPATAPAATEAKA